MSKGINSQNGKDFLDVVRDIRKIPNKIIAEMIQLKMEKEIIAMLGRRPYEKYIGEPYFAGVCQSCGEVVKNIDIVRNGNRRIMIELEHGQEQIKIQRLQHKECGGSIKVDFGLFVGQKRKRSFLEITKDFVVDYAEGMSHRGVARVEGNRNGTSYSAMKSWNTVQAFGCALPEINFPLPKEITLFGDEISIRLREIIKGKKSKKEELYGLELVQLVSGKRLISQVIALDISKERTELAWKKVFENLKSRGVEKISLLVRDGSIMIENAARAVLQVDIVQECHFHRMKSIFERIDQKFRQGELTERRAQKTHRQVYDLFQSRTPKQAREKLEKINDVEIYQKLSDKFEALFGNIDKTNIYLTNNRVEREIREFQRRVYPMDCFKTYSGAINFSKIFLYKEYFRKQQKDWIDETFRTISLNQQDYLLKLNTKLKQEYNSEKISFDIFDKPLGLTGSIRALYTPTVIGEILRNKIRYGEYSGYKVSMELNNHW
jgi:hypothetical protein